MATINGTNGADEIFGTIAADTIDGLAGNDAIDGGAGADTVRGGDGADRLLLSTGDDTLIGGGDVEDMLVTGDASALAIDLGANLARYFLSNEQESGTFDAMVRGMPNIDASDATDAALLSGNRYANRILGGSGDDTVDGRGGNDVLVGNAGGDRFIAEGGIDIIDGGTGRDAIDYSGNAGAVSMVGSRFLDNVSHAQIEFANDATGIDYVRGVERITGTEFGDRLFTAPGLEAGEGNVSTGHLVGGGGNDFLIGFTRSVLDGGAGNDILAAGDGIYRLTGGDDRDLFRVTFAGNQNESETSILDFTPGLDRLQLSAGGRGFQESFDFFDSDFNEVLDENDDNVDVQRVFVAGEKVEAVVLNEFTDEGGSEFNSELRVAGAGQLTIDDFIL